MAYRQYNGKLLSVGEWHIGSTMIYKLLECGGVAYRQYNGKLLECGGVAYRQYNDKLLECGDTVSFLLVEVTKR